MSTNGVGQIALVAAAPIHGAEARGEKGRWAIGQAFVGDGLAIGRPSELTRDRLRAAWETEQARLVAALAIDGPDLAARVEAWRGGVEKLFGIRTRNWISHQGRGE